MATIDNKKIIDEIISNRGYYEDDPRVYMIVEYMNAFGNITWGVTWTSEPNKEKYLEESEYIRNPKIIWSSNLSDEQDED